MAMRCSEWNRDLWRRIWAAADQFRDHPWAEQKALHSLLDAEPQVHHPHFPVKPSAVPPR